MSKLLPYEEQWLSMQAEIRLPDEDMAWADMKLRLEEKKRRRFIWWQWGCLGWGIVLGILLAGGVIWFAKDRITREPDKTSTAVIHKNSLPDSTTTVEQHPVHLPDKTVSISTDTINGFTGMVIPGSGKKDMTQNLVRPPAKNNKQHVTGTNTTPVAKQNLNGNKRYNSYIANTGNTGIDDQQENEKAEITVRVLTDSVKQDTIGRIDTTGIVKPEKDKAKTDSAQAANKNKDGVNKRTKKIYFSAGAGLQQLIPLQGQRLTPYNASGRKGSVGDYIPSVFFKMHNGEKWFLQAEFRYGAPQTTKSFVYKETNVPDTGSAPAFNMISSNQLRKTFYHQLPVTFNYHINKQLSIGLGIQVNRFQAAIGEQKVMKHDNITQGDTLVSKKVFAENNATQSGFAKTYLLGVGELQYQWRRFFIGAKYTYGLQPYIRFTIDGQSEQKESSRSLQIMLRYQCWKSK